MRAGLLHRLTRLLTSVTNVSRRTSLRRASHHTQDTEGKTSKQGQARVNLASGQFLRHRVITKRGVMLKPSLGFFLLSIIFTIYCVHSSSPSTARVSKTLVFKEPEHTFFFLFESTFDRLQCLVMFYLPISN